MAVGDAMGYTVDRKLWNEIQRDYGPNGLLGYDLVNGYADITSYTQLAAYTCCGFLSGLTRGQLRGVLAPFSKYAAMAQREWANIQHTRRDPEKCYCWISRMEAMRRRLCMDTRMLDTLTRDRLGTPQEPVNAFDYPGAVTAAVAAGLFFDPERMEVYEVGTLGAQTVALTHGDPLAFLTGAAVAYCIAGIVQDRETPLQEHFAQAVDAVAAQFGKDYPQAEVLRGRVQHALTLAKQKKIPHPETMEHFGCMDSAQVLAGAVYACLTCGEDFDAAMITAVNHSGRSAAVGALTGALLGAKLGEEALPEFYLECLDCGPMLCTLAEDMVTGTPTGRRVRLFDDSWDRKYVQGEPLENAAWAEI
jgi:ADP-ribosylglycohydrolase